MDVADVQAAVNVLHAAVDERPTENVLVVENGPYWIVAADCELTHLSEAHSLEDGAPDPLPTESRVISRHNSLMDCLPLGGVGTPSVQ